MFFNVLIVFRSFIVALLFASFYFASELPIQAGWENHEIESMQILVLSGGLVFALYCAFKMSNVQQRLFAWMIVPIWIVLIAREMSWGASLLMPPLYIHPETGPVYSSKQLEYRMLMHILACMLVIASGLIFFWGKQYKIVFKLFQQKMFPWFDVCLACIAIMLATIAEGHGFFQISFLNEAQLQVLEEFFELCAYISIFMAQTYVLIKLPVLFRMHSVN